MATNKTYTYGDLVATLTSAFDWTWNDVGSGARYNGGFWIAKPQGPNKALRPLGGLCVNHWNDVNNKWAMLLVGDAGTNKEFPPLASPAGYEPLWNDTESGSKYDGSLWRPVSPPGYKAIGDCLRNDLVNDAGYKKDQTWDDYGSGAETDASVWDVIPTMNNSNEKLLPTFAGTFRVNNAYAPPQATLARVPCLFVSQPDAHLSVHPPAKTAANIPPEGYQEDAVVTGGVTLPFTSFFDPNDIDCLKAIATPFCTINKRARWKVVKVGPNDTGAEKEYEKTLYVGMKESVSTTMEHSVGVSISSEVGLTAKFSVTMNYQFSFSETKAKEEEKGQTITTKWKVPADHISVVWAKEVEFIGIRPDGTSIGGGMSWTSGEPVVKNIPASSA